MNFFQRIKLAIPKFSLRFFNSILFLLEKILFRRPDSSSRKILVYKLGNIGDMICALPAFGAIRRHYPQAEIVLLSSPGQRGAPGAAEILKHAGYFNHQRIYFGDEISSWKGVINLWRELRKEKFDLFIQLPDDWANFRTLARNLFFARFLGVKAAFGFVLRTSNIFKKTQADFLPLQDNEVQSLLTILRQKGGIKSDSVIFDFGETSSEKTDAIKFLDRNFSFRPEKLIGFNLSAKRPAKEWGDANFREIAAYLQSQENCSLVFFGGPNDQKRNGDLIRSLPRPDQAVNAAGFVDLLTARELMRFCLFLVSNDTGAVHLAASANVPVIGLYSIQSLLGKWYPYGENNIILAHRFVNADYRQAAGIAASMKMISVNDVIVACKKILLGFPKSL